MLKPIIREYQDKDLQQTLSIAKQLPDWFDNDALERSIPIDLKHQKTFVAEKADKILDFITLFVAEGHLNIGWLAVHPDLHKNGIGKLLLAQAESYGRSIQICKIATYTLGENVDYLPYNG
ncbi:MAG: GNAT family N-acetyltransferase [Prolixibacteraceae bacterium]|nr:GNAT family N-acetyltransferase [Prolixibacteraceae bacterium]